MATQRVVQTKFWDDDYITELKPKQKLFFLYFLTNPLTNICGIYEITKRRMLFDTGLEEVEIDTFLKKFEKDEKIVYRETWVCAINFIKNQNLNPSVVQGIIRELKAVPKAILRQFVPLCDSLLQDGTLNLTKLNLTKLNLTLVSPDEAGDERDDDFNLGKRIDALKKDPRRHMQIIGLYFTERKLKFENEKQFEAGWKRELKAASMLKGYSDEKILEVINHLKATAKFKWGLETIGKYISENLDELNNTDGETDFEMPAYAKGVVEITQTKKHGK